MKITILGGYRKAFNQDAVESMKKYCVWHFEDHPEAEVQRIREVIHFLKNHNHEEFRIWTNVELIPTVLLVMVKTGEIPAEDVTRIWYSMDGDKHILAANSHGYWDGIIHTPDIDRTLPTLQMALF